MEGLNELAVSTAKKLGVDDAVALTSQGNERMVRFANNSLTVTKNTKETALYVYLGKAGGRKAPPTRNPIRPAGGTLSRKSFVSCRALPRGPDMPSFLKKPRNTNLGERATTGRSR